MGAWDIGPFDNDGACDHLNDLEGGSPADIVAGLSAAMRFVVEAKDYIENPEAEAAVAAAVLVAARFRGVEVSHKLAREFLDAHSFEASDTLRSQALSTLERLESPENNEWYELWNEGEDLEAVWEVLRPYREALSHR